ncbi:hypothetical protein EDE12_101640 [Methylosinus sp. sav-2]|uniref:hypothetical protein n=1 Tax=Methylosinus sp. sav-2 TaxID=2485168 RepID=UPI0004792532|nr:hypothetical protein [Methylosinus sp. sav-2]TDX67098.1 hypothetical protein EDE12_101640 [Methylosinus sp. sav-2]
MRLAAAIFATCVSFSALALELPAASPADMAPAAVAQLDVRVPETAPVVDVAPLPPVIERSVVARPAPAAAHRKVRRIARRPGALAHHSAPPRRRIEARAPLLPTPVAEALRPAPRRCDTIACPRFVLVGVGF